MPDYAKLIEQELRRIEPFQERPEWQQWLAGMEAGLAELSRLVPDLPADPWTEEGARRAEAAALRTFPSWELADPDQSPGNLHLIDPFRRYLGELFVRRFDGTWIFVDIENGHAPEPAVRVPYSEFYFDVTSTLTMAVHRRTGEEWAFIVRCQTEDHQKWVDAGRPEPAVWAQMLEDTD